ncbi:MAG: class I SAM-dependent methyltransferase [Gemmatimonas sp.]|nr:class I SAM-dependent methyltransferase [Gemmatimonas sp.]
MSIPVLQEKKVAGGGRRPGGCFKCGSTDRERLVFAYLRHESGVLDAAPELRVLHIAPEEHLARSMMAIGFREYVGGDLFTEGYEYPEWVRNINILSIPFPADYFDLVICNHVLEHIPDDRAAMRELLRVLRPGRSAVLQVPISTSTHETHEDSSITSSAKREEVFGQFDHVRLYGKDYAQRLEDCGFVVSVHDTSRRFPGYGLNQSEMLYVGRKPVLSY